MESLTQIEIYQRLMAFNERTTDIDLLKDVTASLIDNIKIADVYYLYEEKICEVIGENTEEELILKYRRP